MNNKIIKLNNGLTLVLQPMSTHDNEVNITFLFNGVGSSIDDNKPGIAHLAEHMVFRGTNTMSTADINRQLIYLSNNTFNAYTEYDKTVFQLNTDKNHFNDSIELFVDMFSKSTLDNLEIEQSVIKHELNSYIDNPQRNILNLIQLCYGLKNNDLLQKQYLPLITKSDVQSFIKDNYIPNKSTLIISGNIDDEEIIEAVIKSKTKGWENSHIQDKIFTPLNYNPGYFYKEGMTASTYFCLFFKGAKINDIQESINTAIIKAIANQQMIIDQYCRFDTGLVYGISLIHYICPDHGIFGLTAWTDKDSFQECLKTSMISLKAIKQYIPDYIDQIKSMLKHDLQTQPLTQKDATAEYMNYDLFGIDKNEIIQYIDQTTTQDLLVWFDDTLNSVPSLAVYGDIDERSYSYESLINLWHDVNSDSSEFLN
jgi:predicted Zn-dependent peptidase